MKTKLFGYMSANNTRVKVQPGISAVLSVPLSRFKRKVGCAHGTGEYLKEKDIGKKFNVEILDPVKMGRCTFLGIGYDAIPESDFKKQLSAFEMSYRKKSYLVFRRYGKNACLFIVVAWRCDATPVK